MKFSSHGLYHYGPSRKHVTHSAEIFEETFQRQDCLQSKAKWMNKKGWGLWRLTTNGKPLVLPQSGRRNSVTRLHGRAHATEEAQQLQGRSQRVSGLS